MAKPPAPSLFYALLDTLLQREERLYAARWGTTSSTESESLDFVEGLNRVLEQEVAVGTFDARHRFGQPESPTLHWVFTRLTTPFVQAAPQSLPEGFVWSQPGTDWQEPATCDPRERLLARLIHLGADPWEPIQDNGRHKNPTNALVNAVADLAAFAGYPALLPLAMAHPSAPSVDGYTVPVAYAPEQRSIFAQAIWANALPQVAGLIQLGVDPQNELVHARTPEMARLLLRAGAGLTDRQGAAVADRWAILRSSAEARALVEACREFATPDILLRSVLRGASWRPLAEALAQCPDWADLPDEENTPTAPALRLVLGQLLRLRGKQTGPIRNALRLLEQAGFSSTPVAEGLTEQAMSHVALARLHQQVADILTPTKVEQELATRVYIAQKATGASGKTLQQSTSLALEALLATAPQWVGRPHIGGLAVVGLNETAVRCSAQLSRLKTRPLDDHLALGQWARLIACDPKPCAIPKETWVALFGVDPKNAPAPPIESHLDPRQVILTRLLHAHPAQASEALSASLWQMAAISNNSEFYDVKHLQQTLCPLIAHLDQGLMPSWSIAEAFDFKVAIGRTRFAWPEGHALAERLFALAQESSLEASTAPSPTRLPRGPRL